MKITKKVREEAALICAVSASTRVQSGTGFTYSVIASHLGLDDKSPAFMLAFKAWLNARPIGCDWTQETDAEAEALLRTGWTP